MNIALIFERIQRIIFITGIAVAVGFVLNHLDGLKILSVQRKEESIKFESVTYCGRSRCDYRFLNSENKSRIMTLGKGPLIINELMTYKNNLNLIYFEYELKNKQTVKCVGKIYSGDHEIENTLGLMTNILGTVFYKLDCIEIE